MTLYINEWPFRYGESKIGAAGHTAPTTCRVRDRTHLHHVLSQLACVMPIQAVRTHLHAAPLDDQSNARPVRAGAGAAAAPKALL